MSFLRRMGVGLCTSALLACTVGTETPSLRQSRQPIIGGTLDTTHEAVVLLRSAPSGGGVFECSGTIVKTDPATGVGWVLTGGHCLTDWKPQTVLMGADPEALSTRRYAVLDFHTDYTGKVEDGAHDVGVVRILGVDATTPVMAMAKTTDDLALGSTVTSVGYGRTTPSGNDPAKQARRAITRTLSAIGDGFVRYEMSDGGVCSGDSGGPVIVGAGTTARVVAVHSFVDPDCTGVGTSVRLLSEATFIDAELSKALPALDTCRTCAGRAESGNNVCAKRRDACWGDADCQAVLDCRASCGSASCADECLDKNPSGAGLYLAFQACSCHDACDTQCRDVAGCKAISKCGRPAPPAPSSSACDTCSVTSCCAERRDLSYEKEGWACAADPSSATCAANPKTQALRTCLAKSCATACATTAAPPPPVNDVDGVDAGPPAPATPTNSDDAGGCQLVPGRGSKTTTASWLWLVAVALVLRRRASAS